MLKNEFEDLDLELKDLSPEVRSKAVELFEEMMKENSIDRKLALKKAIEKAENWFMDAEG